MIREWIKKNVAKSVLGEGEFGLFRKLKVTSSMDISNNENKESENVCHIGSTRTHFEEVNSSLIVTQNWRQKINASFKRGHKNCKWQKHALFH